MDTARNETRSHATELKQRLAAEARAAGFDSVGVTHPDAVQGAAGRLEEFLRLGRHGDMGWMETRHAERGHPNALWPEARSVIMLGMNYGPSGDPLAALARTDRGTISVYAQGSDYHDLVKKRLKRVARWLHAESGEAVKVFVDTAPVMEKPLAEAAGIGWQGKHTNLVSREKGSWMFLGAIFSAAELPSDAPETDHCGSCRQCLDICPTAAFPAPYQLDARRCISYLTIEAKHQIPLEFREAMGNRIYGCDDCLAVCPWNKFAATASEAALHARVELRAPLLKDLVRLDDAGFREVFAGSPIKRVGRTRFVRNVLVAIGNSGDAALAVEAERLLGDPSPQVRGMAVWALARLLSPDAFAALAARWEADEADAEVLGEWRTGRGIAAR